MPSTRLSAVMLAICVALIPNFGSTQQPAQTPPTASAPTSGPPPADAPQRGDLELRKLNAEVDKLQVEIEKTRVDKYFGWIAPMASAFTLIVLVATLYFQRKTALDVQAKQAKSALDLQKAQGDAALQLKIVELVMSSRSPYLAGRRAQLLSSLHGGNADSAFLKAVEAMAKDGQFPGDLSFELRTRVFGELAGKYSDPSDVEKLAREIFGDQWVQELSVPPKSNPPGGTGDQAKPS